MAVYMYPSIHVTFFINIVTQIENINTVAGKRFSIIF